MSQYHLQALEQAIEQSPLSLRKKGSGNGYDIAADWTLSRGNSELHILFEGTAENSAHVPSSSYACYLAGQPSVQLYLTATAEEFKQAAADFMTSIQ